MFGGRTPSLKNLALRVLDLNIQEGEHSSAQDAQVAMKLYLQHQRRWEEEAKKRANRIKRKQNRRLEKIAKQQMAQRKVEPNQSRQSTGDQSEEEETDEDFDSDDS